MPWNYVQHILFDSAIHIFESWNFFVRLQLFNLHVAEMSDQIIPRILSVSIKSVFDIPYRTKVRRAKHPATSRDVSTFVLWEYAHKFFLNSMKIVKKISLDKSFYVEPDFQQFCYARVEPQHTYVIFIIWIYFVSSTLLRSIFLQGYKRGDE